MTGQYSMGSPDGARLRFLSHATVRPPRKKSTAGWMVLGALLCGTLLAHPTNALAASPQDRAAADALFDSGVKLMEAEDYEKACPKFQKSFDLDPGVGTLLNLGRCYELAGKHASAWSTYREASAMARQEGQSAREEHARGEAAKLEPKLVRVKVELAEGVSDLPDFKLTQDGVELVVDAVVGEAIPVDPGDHQIVASATGYKSRTIDVKTTEEGETYSVLVEALETDEAAPVPRPVGETAAEAEPAEKQQESVAVEAAPTQPAKQSRSLVGPIVLGSAGVGLAAVGTAFAFIAKGHDNTARDICVDERGGCSSSDIATWEDELSKAKSSATIAYIGWGVGGAAITGAVIWLVAGSPSERDERAKKMELTPVVGGDVWGLSAQGTF